MARKPLRSQLNQVRGWVRQGRTDAWIAHQLDVSASELREFRRRHELSADSEEGGEVDLRDEIEAEIEAAALADAEAADDEDEVEVEVEDDSEVDSDDDDDGEVQGSDGDGPEDRDDPGDQPPARRRRRRRGGRGGRGGGRASTGLQASFDHGENDGYGLWLDPAVKDDPVYTEHWAGNRQVEVTIEPDRIVIKRA